MRAGWWLITCSDQPAVCKRYGPDIAQKWHHVGGRVQKQLLVPSDPIKIHFWTGLLSMIVWILNGWYRWFKCVPEACMPSLQSETAAQPFSSMATTNGLGRTICIVITFTLPCLIPFHHSPPQHLPASHAWWELQELQFGTPYCSQRPTWPLWKMLLK